MREEQARARRQARPVPAGARRPSVEERALTPRSRSGAANHRSEAKIGTSTAAAAHGAVPTIAELMARQREALSIPRCARPRPPPGSFYRDFVREAPPVGSYEVTYP